jgi:micrococcal nuclease
MADFHDLVRFSRGRRGVPRIDEMPVRTSWHGADGSWPSHKRKPLLSIEVILMIVLGVSSGLTFALFDPISITTLAAMRSSASTTAIPRHFGFCHVGGGSNCVVDGDTFWMDGQKIRIADIDTPETHPPRCAEEAALGAQATIRLHALLNAGPVTLESAQRDTDRYGRALRIVTRNGQSLGATLVAEGLARRWEGSRRPWCESA